MVALLMVRLFRLAGLCLAAVLAVACDKVPLFAPSQSTITLTAGRRVLALNSSVEVTAVVVEPSGTPVQNGTSVRFSTTLGHVDPVEVETRNGVATTTFHAGSTSGVADVRAISGAAGGTSSGDANATTATNLVTFTIGAAAAKTVTVRANPSSVPPSGGTVEVSAVVLDERGQGVAEIPVTFSADHGTLSNIVSTSKANGVATVGLTTNILTKVTATAGSAPSATVDVTVQTAPAITVTCQGTTLTSCSQTVGQPVTFTVSKAAAGSSPLVSAVLTFGDGESATLGTLNSPVTVTHTYSSVSAYTATVTATDGNGQTTTASVALNVTARPPLTVTLTPTSGTATTTGHSFSFALTVTAGAETTSTPLLVESVAWDFGDGNTASTSGLSTAHVFTATANRTVSATVRTQDGRTGTARTTVAVTLTARPPLTVTIAADTSATAIAAGHRVALTASIGTSDSTALVESVSWAFGDGSDTVSTSGLTTAHVYTADGTYTITATVRTQDGRSGTGRTEVLINIP